MVVLKRDMSSNECRFYMSEAGRVRHAPEAGRLTSDRLSLAGEQGVPPYSVPRRRVFDHLSFRAASLANSGSNKHTW